MKATLEFNLPEEEEEHQTAFNGAHWRSISIDMDQYLRNKIKYAQTEYRKLLGEGEITVSVDIDDNSDNEEFKS